MTTEQQPVKRYMYRICTQVNPTDDVIIRNLCLRDDDTMRRIVSRMVQCPLEELSFCEVHKHDTEAKTAAIVIDTKKPWPKGVAIRTMNSISVRPKNMDEEEIREMVNKFFEKNEAENREAMRSLATTSVPALPPPPPNPTTIPLTRYTLKVA